MITEEMHVESFLIWMVHSPVDIAKISWFKFDYTVSMCNDKRQNTKWKIEFIWRCQGYGPRRLFLFEVLRFGYYQRVALNRVKHLFQIKRN